MRRFKWRASILAVIASAVFLVAAIPAQAAPANDNVANAQDLGSAPNVSVAGTNVAATNEANEPHGKDFLNRNASTVWYRWTARSASDVNIDNCTGASFHTIIAVFSKTADPVPPFSNLNEIGSIGGTASNNDGCPTEYGAAGILSPIAGTVYYIQISGFAATDPPNGDRGPFTLKLTSAAAPATPAPPTVAAKLSQGDLGKVNLNTSKGTATITVNVPGPGNLTVSGAGVKAQRAAAAAPEAGTARAVSAAGPVKLVIKAKGAKKKQLNKTGKVKLKLEITFTPTGGSPSTQPKTVKLKKKV